MERHDIYCMKSRYRRTTLPQRRNCIQGCIAVAGYETCSYGSSISTTTSSARRAFRAARCRWAGGLTETLKIAHMAQAANLPMPAHPRLRVAVAAAVHLLGAVRNGSMQRPYIPHALMNETGQGTLLVDRKGDITLSERPARNRPRSKIVKKYRVSKATLPRPLPERRGSLYRSAFAIATGELCQCIKCIEINVMPSRIRFPAPSPLRERIADSASGVGRGREAMLCALPQTGDLSLTCPRAGEVGYFFGCQLRRVPAFAS